MAILKIAALAKKLNKSVSDMAQETGLNRNTITALFRGEVEGVRLSTIEKICKVYGVALKDIIEMEYERSTQDTRQEYPERVYKQEAEIVPFTCWPWALVSGTYRLMHEGKEFGFGTLRGFFKEEYGEAYWDHDALRSLALAFYEIYAHTGTYTKLYTQYLVHASKIEDIYLHTFDIPIEKIGTEKLRALFEELAKVYQSFWETSLFIDAFDSGVDHEHITALAAKHNFSKAEIQVLTTPLDLTFADERKFAIMHIIKKMITSRNASSLDVRDSIEKNKDAFVQYQRQFDYYKSNYVYIHHITFNEIQEEIEKYLRDKDLFNTEYARFDLYRVHKEKEIASILKAHRLKQNPLSFFQHLTYWREHRKKINLMGIHALDYILSGIEQGTGIQKKYLRYLSFDEVDNVLKGLIPSSVLEKRREQGALVQITHDHYKIFEGEEARSIRNDLEHIVSGKESHTILTGQTASQGYAKGIARIIMTQKDFDQFKEGEILVTSMTRPEFIPLMKKAAGIVTNEGGITCHAAIVSRELGKPCVIGTKIATQVIKNGDVVEVRANHGTVRVL